MELLRAHKKDVTARMYELRVHLAAINRKLRDGWDRTGQAGARRMA